MRLFAVLGILTSAALHAQPSVPLRYLAPEMRIDGHELSKKLLWPVGTLAVDSAGRIILWPNNSNAGINAFDAEGKPLPYHISTGFRGETEIRWPDKIGRFGKKMWISDPYDNQVVFVSPEGKVTGGISHPTWVHAKWNERRKFPLFGGMEVIAVYPDTEMLVAPRRLHTLLDTPGYDRKAEHLLRIKADGQIQREIARFSDDSWRLVLNGADPRSEHVSHVPFGARTFWSASRDGSRVIIAAPATTAADHGAFHLISIDGQGDTVYSRRFPMADVPVTAAQADSALKGGQGFGDKSAQEIKESLRKRIPAYRSYLTQVIAGFDQSAWVFTRSTIDSSQAREALIVDPRGEPLARVEIPAGFNPLYADREHLWGVNKRKPSIIRYKVQATPAPVTVAPPPRTEKAAAAKD